MGLGYNSEEEDKWWEILIGWKWPHQGFTLGYDLVEPDAPSEENEMVFYSILIYLGPLSIICNWGKHSWNE